MTHTYTDAWKFHAETVAVIDGILKLYRTDEAGHHLNSDEQHSLIVACHTLMKLQDRMAVAMKDIRDPAQ